MLAVMATLKGIHHVALSVKDLDASIAWYTDILGLSVEFRDDQGEERHMAVLRIPGTGQQVGLVQHLSGGAPFDPTSLGLDTAAFAVASGEELDEWAALLNARGVVNGGVLPAPFGGMLNFKDPDGIALALFWDQFSPVEDPSAAS